MKDRKNGRWSAALLAIALLVWICAGTGMAEGASGDNSLSTLGITTEGVSVSPEFYYSTIEYQVTVPAGTTRLELNPVTSNPNAWIVDIQGQDIGENGETTVVITVSAENGNQYAYYLYVKTDQSAQTETETEPVTEAQTEPQTEDPRYVKVDRNSLQEAENTISALKSETSSFRDRVTLLTRILYGMIGLCVILLFVVINLILKKKDLKSELQEYRSYGYTEQDPVAEEAPVPDKKEKKRRKKKQANTPEAEEPERMTEYRQERETAQAPYEAPVYQEDDPATVPHPSDARKKARRMPEYQKPEPEHPYQPSGTQKPEEVEINMIDL